MSDSRTSESQFVDIRGLRYHVRHWRGTARPLVVLLHGWMDVSASFQFLVDALPRDWDLCAPDWRGYGLTDWGGSDSYWFADYLADLDALLDRVSPERPVHLVGHSLGGNVSALYAGVRPERIVTLINLEGFGLVRSNPLDAPKRYAKWLDQLRGGKPALRDYDSFAALADRMQKTNPRLPRDRAEFLARHWGRETQAGRVMLRGDPVHKVVNPLLYRYDEAEACWRNVSSPVLWVDAADTDLLKRARITPEDHAARRAAFTDLEYVTIADAGHMLHHDQPAVLARVIEAFLARHR